MTAYDHPWRDDQGDPQCQACGETPESGRLTGDGLCRGCDELAEHDDQVRRTADRLMWGEAAS
jgi:hypothetical protein